MSDLNTSIVEMLKKMEKTGAVMLSSFPSSSGDPHWEVTILVKNEFMPVEHKQGYAQMEFKGSSLTQVVEQAYSAHHFVTTKGTGFISGDDVAD